MGKGEETRRAILDKALALATQIGLEGLTIGRLAKEAGMSKSGLFAHFASKENLQIAVLELAVERFIDTVVLPALQNPRGEPRLRALFENWFEWSQADFLPGGCLFIAASREFEDRTGPVRDFLVHDQRRWLDKLAQASRGAVQEGHFRPDLDPGQMAYDIYAIIFAYHHFSRLLEDGAAAEYARRAFENLIAAASSQSPAGKAQTTNASE